VCSTAFAPVLQAVAGCSNDVPADFLEKQTVLFQKPMARSEVQIPARPCHSAACPCQVRLDQPQDHWHRFPGVTAGCTPAWSLVV